jgi:hypothetical protein
MGGEEEFEIIRFGFWTLGFGFFLSDATEVVLNTDTKKGCGNCVPGVVEEVTISVPVLLDCLVKIAPRQINRVI